MQILKNFEYVLNNFQPKAAVILIRSYIKTCNLFSLWAEPGGQLNSYMFSYNILYFLFSSSTCISHD